MKQADIKLANELNEAIKNHTATIDALKWLIRTANKSHEDGRGCVLNKPYRMLASFKLRVFPWIVGIGVKEENIELPKETLPIACEAILIYMKAERAKLISQMEEI